MLSPQFLLDIRPELIVDLFAGGGGMSTGIEQATGLYPDIACNHNADAISMHQANHPQTQHYQADVFELCPRDATQGRPVGLLHASPDCTHHSQAAGGQPRDRKIRALSWVVTRWAGQASPRVITLENVKQITKWGPLIAKRDKASGRVIKTDGSIAAPGEVVPIGQQYLIPNPKKAGRTWRHFVRTLENMGYQVEWRILVAADYGAPTTRERLFMCARRDGQPIVWPKPTHHKQPARGQKKWRAAAECIDWTIPGKSIFNRPKPLADATMRRIAKGIKRFVIDNPQPFIVKFRGDSSGHNITTPLPTITSGGDAKRLAGGAHAMAVCQPCIVPIAHYNGSNPVHPGTEPLRTITAHHKGGAFAVAQPLLAPVQIQAAHGEGSGKTQRRSIGSKDMAAPIGTITASGSGGHAVATAYMMQANGGFYQGAGRAINEPASTITNSGSQQQLVSALVIPRSHGCDSKRWGHPAKDARDPFGTICAQGSGDFSLVSACLMRQFGTSTAANIGQPCPTITTDGAGGKTGLISCQLAQTQAAALEVTAFLINYYGNGDARNITAPRDTVTTSDRLALVTVHLNGEPYYIVDISLRMLEPHELYKAQGFPADYIITHGHDGRKFSKSAQVRMCGNSVSPPPAAALIRANYSAQQQKAQDA